MFYTTLFRAVQSADRVRVFDYDAEQIEFENGVMTLIPDSDDGCFFFKDQPVAIYEDGTCTAKVCADPEDETDFGGIVESFVPEARDFGVAIEFHISRPMLEADLRPA